VSAEDLVHRRLYGHDRGKDDRQNSAAPEQKNAENVPIFSYKTEITVPQLCGHRKCAKNCTRPLLLGPRQIRDRRKKGKLSS
jgi:hypothetical protein